MVKQVAVLLLLTACSVAQNGGQQKDTPRVSSDFAKAANLYLVAVKNNSTSKLVEEAVNNADAAAISPEEVEALRRMRVMAMFRGIQYKTWSLTLDNTASLLGPKSTPEALNNDPNVVKARVPVDQADACIAAWRLALRDLEGVEPAACKYLGNQKPDPDK